MSNAKTLLKQTKATLKEIEGLLFKNDPKHDVIAFQVLKNYCIRDLQNDIRLLEKITFDPKEL